MTKFLCKTLRFFNLVDRSCNLSITNIAVIVCVAKIAIAPTFSIAEVGALLISLVNYGHKRTESAKAEKADKEIAAKVIAVQAATSVNEVDARVSEIKSAVEKVVEVQNKITTDMATIRTSHDSVAKIAEEAKKIMSQNNLASAMKPFQRRGE